MDERFIFKDAKYVLLGIFFEYLITFSIAIISALVVKALQGIFTDLIVYEFALKKCDVVLNFFSLSIVVIFLFFKTTNKIICIVTYVTLSLFTGKVISSITFFNEVSHSYFWYFLMAGFVYLIAKLIQYYRK